jgi:SAM-dependent methyltransferase
MGCGLGVEVDYLQTQGWHAIGIDLSVVALRSARRRTTRPLFVRADVSHLPIADQRVDLAIDRGCLHYLDPAARISYLAEIRRVIRPGGRFLLRACCNCAGQRNDVDKTLLAWLLAGWHVESLTEAMIPSDTRSMAAIVARLVAP